MRNTWVTMARVLGLSYPGDEEAHDGHVLALSDVRSVSRRDSGRWSNFACTAVVGAHHRTAFAPRTTRPTSQCVGARTTLATPVLHISYKLLEASTSCSSILHPTGGLQEAISTHSSSIERTAKGFSNNWRASCSRTRAEWSWWLRIRKPCLVTSTRISTRTIGQCPGSAYSIACVVVPPFARASRRCLNIVWRMFRSPEQSGPTRGSSRHGNTCPSLPPLARHFMTAPSIHHTMTSRSGVGFVGSLGGEDVYMPGLTRCVNRWQRMWCEC